MAKGESATRGSVKDSIRIEPPKKYKVVFHNDDFTTMDFVVRVLMEVFFKLETEAIELMLKVHNEGKATVGVYSRDIALSKVSRASKMARAENFPLSITVESE